MTSASASANESRAGKLPESGTMDNGLRAFFSSLLGHQLGMGNGMLKKFLMTVGVVASLLTGGQQAVAATLVDTGPGTGTSWLFGSSQWFAGEFTLTDHWIVESLEAHLNIFNGGNVTVRILGDGGNVPNSTTYFSQSFLASTGQGWQGVFGTGPLLMAGTYWAEFQPDSSIIAAWEGGAPNPLDEYALYTFGGWQDYGPNALDFLQVGVRIEGFGPVPLPAGGLLLISALGGIAVLRRRRRTA